MKLKLLYTLASIALLTVASCEAKGKLCKNELSLGRLAAVREVVNLRQAKSKCRA